jgi:hypothetical protein
MKLEFFRESFDRYSNIKSHENPSSELFHADGRTDRQTDKSEMTKLIVALSNFANAPKKLEHFNPLASSK